ncbi:MAG: ABC transporter permease [Vicinamibacterales bacterium]
MRRIFYLAQAEFLHVLRDKATLAQALVVPVVQLLILSNAATFEVANTPAWIVDLDRSVLSRGLVSRMGASEHFEIIGDAPSMAQAGEAMLAGEATLVLTIPRGFEEDLVETRRARVEIAVNAEKGAAAGIVQSYAARILNDYSREVLPPARRSLGGGGWGAPSRGAAIDIRQRARYNPTLNYAHYMVPGILVGLITIIGTLLTSQNIAREKELGTLEQLNVTPITRGQFIAGKLLPFWGLALVELGIGLAVGVLVFDIPVRGNPLLLFAAAAVYMTVVLGVGLWISTLVHTQQQAMFVSFFIIVIYLLMSGLFTPIDSMEPWVQDVTLANPVRHFVQISRAILIKGAGIEEIVQPLLVLALMGAAALTFAVRQHHKRTA